MVYTFTLSFQLFTVLGATDNPALVAWRTHVHAFTQFILQPQPVTKSDLKSTLPAPLHLGRPTPVRQHDSRIGPICVEAVLPMKSATPMTDHPPTQRAPRAKFLPRKSVSPSIVREQQYPLGILHLYRNPLPNALPSSTVVTELPTRPLVANPVAEGSHPSAASHPSGSSRSMKDSDSTPGPSRLLCILAIPSYLDTADLLAFLGGYQESIAYIRTVRDSLPNRYMALLVFRQQEDTDRFYTVYNGRPFSSLEPEQCHVAYISQISVEHTTIPDYALPLFYESLGKVVPIDPPGKTSCSASQTLQYTKTYANEQTSVPPSSAPIPSPPDHLQELPNCPVCLESLDASATGLLTILCQHTFHCNCLSRWGDGSCPVCRYSTIGRRTITTTSTSSPSPGKHLHHPSHRTTAVGHALGQLSLGSQASQSTTVPSGGSRSLPGRDLTVQYPGESDRSNPDSSQSPRGNTQSAIDDGQDEREDTQACNTCGARDQLWICLICANIGCGRYQDAHAHQHFLDTGHLFSLELESQRVWDYAGEGYVHRLIQNTADGKLVELPDPGTTEQAQGATVPEEKLDALGVEYTNLLTSQLDSQRRLYESRISQLQADWHQAENSLIVTRQSQVRIQQQLDQVTEELTRTRSGNQDLLHEKHNLEKRLGKLHDQLSKLERRHREEHDLNVSLLANQDHFKSRLEEKDRQITELQEQVSDLMAYFTMQDKVTKDASLQGASVGVVSAPSSSSQTPKNTPTKSKSKKKRG
ncbi:hypothetical protein IWQ62_003538 [Dispira parvispora]|uniref:Uncharacterized protein n=1 Tax=Dispira parvispora TaxID=1520584 RepID=A0A9W8AMQ3_9FUNG|nr:hypothetical protein IWQ62_003538 [Dispira parvispora]